MTTLGTITLPNGAAPGSILSIILNAPPVVTPPIQPAPTWGYNSLNQPAQSGGWTLLPLTVTAGRHNIFVSSSTGNDANDGSVQTAPIKTLIRLQVLLQTYGHGGTHVYFMNGDTFARTDGQAMVWMNGSSGGTPADPFVVTAYGVAGAPRPAFQCGTANFITILGAPTSTRIVGLDILADPKVNSQPSNGTFAQGIACNGAMTDWVLEDLLIQNFTYGINLVPSQTGSTVVGQPNGIVIRRNRILDSYTYTPNTKAQGIYLALCQQVLLEENTFDHNGWNANVKGAGPTDQNHNAYTTNCAGLTFRGNLTSQASSYGLTTSSDAPQQFTSANVSNNVFLNNGNDYMTGAIGTTYQGNVFQGAGQPGTIAQGLGVYLAGNNATMSGNYHLSNQVGSAWITLDPKLGAGVTVTGEIVAGWNGGVAGTPPAGFAEPAAHPAPWSSLVPASLIQTCRGMSRANWSPAIANALAAVVAGH